MGNDRARVRNAADPEQVKEAGLHDAFTKANRIADMRKVLATGEGRRVLWWWLVQTHQHKSITVTSSEIYARSGRRDVGLELIEAITQADPEAYLLMQREAAKLEADKVEPTTHSEE